jgi:hypothetical protein
LVRTEQCWSIQKHGTTLQSTAQRADQALAYASQIFRVRPNIFGITKKPHFPPHFSNHKNLKTRFRCFIAALSTITMVNRIAIHINAHSSSPSKVSTDNRSMPSSPKRLPLDEMKHPHSPSAASVASSSEDSAKLASDLLITPENATRAVVSPDHASIVDKLPIEELTLTTVLKSEHKLAEEAGEFDEEPLLKESKHRFVLFPIQDNDVRTTIYTNTVSLYTYENQTHSQFPFDSKLVLDLENVQASRSEFLDCRRD